MDWMLLFAIAGLLLGLHDSAYQNKLANLNAESRKLVLRIQAGIKKAISQNKITIDELVNDILSGNANKLLYNNPVISTIMDNPEIVKQVKQLQNQSNKLNAEAEELVAAINAAGYVGDTDKARNEAKIIKEKESRLQEINNEQEAIEQQIRTLSKSQRIKPNLTDLQQNTQGGIK